MDIISDDCPRFLITALNSWVDYMSEIEWGYFSSSSPNNEIPDLLDRGFETLFLSHIVCDRLGFTDCVLPFVENVIGKKVILPTSTFSSDYADVWVNRYFQGNETPLHRHAYDISGIIMLKIPDKSPILEFVTENKTYRPLQEEGKIFLFPSDLQHKVYPQKITEERRTLSFNLKIV